MERVENYFMKNVKKGRVLSVAELVKYAKTNQLGLEDKKVRSLRRRWKFMAMFAKLNKPPTYASLSFHKPGIIFIDLAEFSKEDRDENDGCAGKNMYKSIKDLD
jgi:hypothetical protein